MIRATNYFVRFAIFELSTYCIVICRGNLILSIFRRRVVIFIFCRVKSHSEKVNIYEFFFSSREKYILIHTIISYMVVVLNYIVYNFVGDTEIQLKMR